MAPQTHPPIKTTPLPKTAIELAAWSVRELGFAVVLAAFIFVQWRADQARTARIEAILVSNAEVLRTNSVVMERLGIQWQLLDSRAAEFIDDVTRDIDQIKLNTTKL